MTSLTWQKDDLRDEIIDLWMKRYEQMDKGTKIFAIQALVSALCRKMTVKMLLSWRETISEAIRLHEKG